MRICRPWTREERAFLRECSAIGLTADKLEPFFDRTQAAICQQRCHLGIYVAKKARNPSVGQRVTTPFTVAQIKSVVSNAFGVAPDTLSSPCRARRVTAPRHVAMYLSHDLTNQSLSNIGRLFGGRDHTTVIHAVRKVSGKVGEDQQFKDRIETIRNEIVSAENDESCGKVSFADESRGA